MTSEQPQLSPSALGAEARSDDGALVRQLLKRISELETELAALKGEAHGQSTPSPSSSPSPPAEPSPAVVATVGPLWAKATLPPKPPPACFEKLYAAEKKKHLTEQWAAAMNDKDANIERKTIIAEHFNLSLRTLHQSGIITTAAGERVIPQSVRSNGSIRAVRPVRPGYTPPEDRNVYQAPASRSANCVLSSLSTDHPIPVRNPDGAASPSADPLSENESVLPYTVPPNTPITESVAEQNDPLPVRTTLDPVIYQSEYWKDNRVREQVCRLGSQFRISDRLEARTQVLKILGPLQCFGPCKGDLSFDSAWCKNPGTSYWVLPKNFVYMGYARDMLR
ncbi:MAG: hypothetical protein M1836_003708 [Candelina mexicana]|nr:MAG: hypothetical protein M1836_003708 [Candelina mexicana]